VIRVDDRHELRPIVASDADALLGAILAARAHLDQWLPDVRAIRTRQDAADWIARRRHARAVGSSEYWGLWDGGQLIGVAGYHALDHEARTASLGCWLVESRTGRGTRTRSLHALLDSFVETIDLARVWWDCDASNAASRALAERIGFAFDHLDGQQAWYRLDLPRIVGTPPA
jgi:ribosomal-protein-serine acetyltransferase